MRRPDCQRILTFLIELDALVAHHQLIGLEIGGLQRRLDLGGIGRCRAIDRIASTKNACNLRAAVSSIVVALFLFVNLGISAVGAPAADAPRRSVERALRDLAGRLDERGIGISGISAMIMGGL